MLGLCKTGMDSCANTVNRRTTTTVPCGTVRYSPDRRPPTLLFIGVIGDTEMKKTSLLLSGALAAAGLMAASNAMADITFYAGENFNGPSFTTERQVRNLERYGFNDRASSLTVVEDRWEVCENAGFQGRCVIVRPGNYPSLAAIGLNNRISSVRMVERDPSDPPPPPVSYYDAH